MDDRESGLPGSGEPENGLDVSSKGQRSRAAAMRAGIWALLLTLSVMLSWVLRLLHMPAALMLGPMLAGITLALQHGGLKVRRPIVLAAQGLLGCRLGMAMSPDLLQSTLGYLPTLFAMTFLVLFGTVALAITTSRAGWFPEATAVWGLSPGAASAMVMLAEMYGSDARIVAVMQYLRVVASALVAILVGTFLGAPEAHPGVIPSTGGAVIWFPPIHGVAFSATLGLALLGAVAARLSGRSIAVLFVPMIGGGLLQAFHLGELELPAFVMAAAYAIIGWNIGLKFTRATLAASLRLMPRIIAMVVAMLALCGLLSIALARLLHVDALSAYLALSPGGLDSVIIIATSTKVDLPLVLATQVVRLIVVMLVAPPLARYIVGRGLHGGRARPKDDDA